MDGGMDGGMDRPLFGEARPRDRFTNYIIGIVTSILVLVTLISSLVYPHWPPAGINVFFALVISLICLGQLAMIYWYRQGDVDPKFRKLIYYNCFTTILLCVCANVYYHRDKTLSSPTTSPSTVGSLM